MVRNRLLSEQTTWLRECHKASRVGIMLLRLQCLRKLNAETTSGDGTVLAYYSYLACFQHYYSAEYKYTIRHTIRTK